MSLLIRFFFEVIRFLWNMQMTVRIKANIKPSPGKSAKYKQYCFKAGLFCLRLAYCDAQIYRQNTMRTSEKGKDSYQEKCILFQLNSLVYMYFSRMLGQILTVIYQDHSSNVTCKSVSLFLVSCGSLAHGANRIHTNQIQPVEDIFSTQENGKQSRSV